MLEFDWEQEGFQRLHHLERENADLRREIAYWRELLRRERVGNSLMSPTPGAEQTRQRYPSNHLALTFADRVTTRIDSEVSRTTAYISL